MDQECSVCERGSSYRHSISLQRVREIPKIISHISQFELMTLLL